MSAIRYLVFDLDDTLYTGSSGLFREVGERIEAWVTRTLGISASEAKALRRQYFQAYGTTMGGLIRHHPEVDVEDYLEDVHRVDVSQYLRADPQLDAMLSDLPCDKAIFTNAISDWAERVLTQLGIRQHFGAIVDVRAVALRGKPHPDAFRQLLALLHVPGEACVLIDDQARNVQQGAAFGMRTVLVQPGATIDTGIDYAVDNILATGPVLKALLDGHSA